MLSVTSHLWREFDFHCHAAPEKVRIESFVNKKTEKPVASPSRVLLLVAAQLASIGFCQLVIRCQVFGS